MNTINRIFDTLTYIKNGDWNDLLWDLSLRSKHLGQVAHDVKLRIRGVGHRRRIGHGFCIIHGWVLILSHFMFEESKYLRFIIALIVFFCLIIYFDLMFYSDSLEFFVKLFTIKNILIIFYIWVSQIW